MSHTTEALKLSTVALKDIACTSQTDDLLWWQIRAREALAAIRDALAKPVKQEPVAWHEPNSYGNVTTHKKWAEENGWLPLYTKE